MTISIRRAKGDDKSAIANLIQLYLHDMTEFMPFPVGSDGRFEYGFLDRFWRHPISSCQAKRLPASRWS